MLLGCQDVQLSEPEHGPPPFSRGKQRWEEIGGGREGSI